MKILVACEHSGVVRDAFLKLGHDAWSCDLLPSLRPGPHIRGDVREVLDKGWDMLLGYPPCTYLCNSGAKHLYKKQKKKYGYNPDRVFRMRSGGRFFRTLWDAPIKYKCLENPIMLGQAMAWIELEPTQVIHPWMFGHMEQKSTCLYLSNLPPLEETHNVYDEMMKLPVRERQRIWHMSPGKKRGLERSVTFQGIADAKADQWGYLGQGLKPRPPKKFNHDNRDRGRRPLPV